jgi:hypothetical protein
MVLKIGFEHYPAEVDFGDELVGRFYTFVYNLSGVRRMDCRREVQLPRVSGTRGQLDYGANPERVPPDDGCPFYRG